jgi:hypothetical protein
LKGSGIVFYEGDEVSIPKNLFLYAAKFYSIKEFFINQWIF